MWDWKDILKTKIYVLITTVEHLCLLVTKIVKLFDMIKGKDFFAHNMKIS